MGAEAIRVRIGTEAILHCYKECVDLEDGRVEFQGNLGGKIKEFGLVIQAGNGACYQRKRHGGK
jgi:hypothetical protein